MKKITLLVTWALSAAILQAMVMSQPAKASTYYVSPTGSDLNAGTTPDGAFRTVQQAADIVNPGDVVIVQNGTYNNPSAVGSGGNLVYLHRGGTAGNWITFQSATRWGAVLDGLNNTTGDAWNFGAGANYIRVVGFEVHGFSGVAFDNYGGGQNLDIKGNHIHDIGRLCTDTTIGLDAIFLSNSHVIVEQNLIHDIGRYAPGENGCSPMTTYYQSNDHGVYICGASDVIVRNNIFYNNERGWSVTIYNSELTASSNIEIVNNTFAFANPWQPGQVFLGSPVLNSLIANNIFYQPQSEAIHPYYMGTYGQLSISNNMTYWSVVTRTTLAGVNVSNNFDQTDPLLVNPGAYNFMLTSGSPAIGRGLRLSEVPDDFTGAPRPQRKSYAIGAYE